MTDEAKSKRKDRDLLVILFAEAVAHYEGFYRNDRPTLARRQNNPGNLRNWGRYPVENGYAVFPDRSRGFAALRHQIRKNLFSRKLSILEFFAGKPGVYAGYAPSADHNEPDKYAKYVADFLSDRGIPTTPLNVFL